VVYDGGRPARVERVSGVGGPTGREIAPGATVELQVEVKPPSGADATSRPAFLLVRSYGHPPVAHRLGPVKGVPPGQP
jgi:hypothetical protein